jgi:hypothetical protein
MSLFKWYVLTRLEDIKTTSAMIAVASIAMILLSGLVYFSSGTTSADRDFSVIVFKISAWSLGISLPLALLLPSREDLAIMFAGTWATNSESMKQLPDAVSQAALALITKYTKQEGEKK